MRRRDFITLLGGATVAWPVAARGQQQGPMPVIGFLSPNTPEFGLPLVTALKQGLKEVGYIDGENVAIEFRWAEGRYDRLSEMSVELVRRRVAAIIAISTASSLAAKTATATIPIVFAIAEDPVRLGLVASIARPGGNATGINFFSSVLTAKRLGLLRELVPGAARMAVLVNPTAAANTEATLRDVAAAARTLDLQIQVLNASTSREIDAAFATLVRERLDALFVGSDAFFIGRRAQLVNLASRYAVPASYGAREFAEIGGLMCYGARLTDAYRQVGDYTGRILKGVKPEDLPVVQSSKFELVINAQTARMLGLAVPPTLLATADEVIE